ncbi:MAG TPA: DUF2157 domain-containing protein [Puia sp.]|jgi:hypothetical protein
MNLTVFKRLHSEGLISDTSLERVRIVEEKRLFSVHWELKTLLYLGVVMLSGGLGILVYKNIETIGHQTILLFIALVCGGCFYYCLHKAGDFSRYRAAAPDPFFDYILLLGCLSFLTFIGYLQFEYTFFGSDYRLATFIPMVVLFISAYYFDHMGVLSLAITNLAAWVGISVTPLRILRENDFHDHGLIYTGLALGVVLLMAGVASERRNFKKHFEFTYENFGTHILFISGLAGLFTFDGVYLGWFLLFAGVAAYFYREALKRRSFYFLLVDILYTYVALSYVVVRLLMKSSIATNDFVWFLYLGFFYFVLSAIGVVRLLIILNRKMRVYDSL